MKTLLISDDMQGQALVNVETITMVTKPALKDCTSREGSKSQKWVMEIMAIGSKVALFFTDEERAMDQYQDVMLAMTELESAPYIPATSTDWVIHNNTGQPPADNPQINWEYINSHYTPGRGDVSFSPLEKNK